MMESNTASHTTIPFKGLTAAEVQASREKYGANIVTPPERAPWWKLYLEKFNDPIIRILIIAAIIAIGIGIVDGTYYEGIGIIIAIFLATYLGFLNEYQAAKEFEVLSRTNDEYQIQVIRDGIYTSVPKKDLVVGDLVLIEVGSEVPADGRLIEAVSLQVDEASFTGESAAVNKVSVNKAPLAKEEETTYPRDQLLRGSMVVDGRGILELTAVGDATEIGQIAQELGGEDKVETPLNLQLDRLSKLIGVLAFIIAVMIIAALTGRGIITNELNLSPQQWVFVGILAVSVIILLVRVWLPMFYDGLELLGSDTEPPGWLQNEDLMGWLKTIVLGLAVFAVCVGVGYILNVIPASPRDWLPAVIGHKFLTYFMIAMTVIVVAVPEGLPMSVTLSLAYSMRKMMATNNLVRRMHACETIGAATVICADKTGTLTMNEMRVFAADFPALAEGKLSKTPEKTFAEQLVIESIASNSTANLSRIPGEPACPLGNPTECSLLLWLDAQGIDYMYHRTNLSLQYQWTFSTERKFMGTIGQSAFTGTNILYIKGAPEIVLDRCTKILTPGGVHPVAGFRAGIDTALIGFQERGMRTLGFAYHEDPVSHEGNRLREIATGLTWLGFVAISDPLRKEVPAAIQACQGAGITVKMITGDNSKTAQEISRQIGLWQEHDPEELHLTGTEFGQLTVDQARDVVGKVKIFSRARPKDKLQIVKTLQDIGEVVAVTGDGVNDGTALKQAHVGLAMGKTGTDAAKEASDIILLDDSFTSIANAVKWGRSLYENIQRFILFQLTINVAACFIALLGPFIGIPFPLTVIQMLWVNLIMDTFAALALATEPPHDSVMKQPPRDPQAFIVTRPMAINIFTVGFIFLIFLVGFLYFIQKDGPPTSYQLTKFFTVFVMLNFWNLFNARCLGNTDSAFAGISQNKGFIIIATAIFIGQVLMVQFGGSFFRTVALSFRDWALIVAGTSIVLWVGEIWRLIRRLRA